jgi:hypothetical protein
MPNSAGEDEAMAGDDLAKNARKQQRHRLAANIGQVIKEAGRRGAVWVSADSGYYNRLPRVYHMPPKADILRAIDWARKHKAIFIQYKEISAVESYPARDILRRSEPVHLARKLCSVLRYPADLVSDVFWPALIDEFADNWHGYTSLVGIERNTLIVSEEESQPSLLESIQNAFPQGQWRRIHSEMSGYRSDPGAVARILENRLFVPYIDREFLLKRFLRKDYTTDDIVFEVHSRGFTKLW